MMPALLLSAAGRAAGAAAGYAVTGAGGPSRTTFRDLDSTVNPAFFTFFMNKDPDAEPPLRAAFEATLDNLEQDLATHGGPYLCGSAYSLADVSGLPFFERMAVALLHWKGWAFDGARHPKLVAWMALVFQREAFQKVQLGDAKIIETYQKFRDMDYKFGGLAKGK